MQDRVANLQHPVFSCMLQLIQPSAGRAACGCCGKAAMAPQTLGYQSLNFPGIDNRYGTPDKKASLSSRNPAENIINSITPWIPPSPSMHKHFPPASHRHL